MLRTTTAQSKIGALRKRLRIVQGGTSASKTFSILPVLIDYAVKNTRKEISVVAETIPHLKRGALKDFIKILEWTGNYSDSKFNKTDLRYTFSNGSYIEFFSADHPDKLRGARRDVLFINEANNVSFESYQQLAIRTKEFIYLDFNPTASFWVHDLTTDKDAQFIKLTYKDNEALDPAIVAEIEKAREKAKTSAYWANWWKVYGLGEIGSLQGVVFDNWTTIDTMEAEARYLATGLDFGYTNDPTAAIDVYMLNGEVIFDELFYRKGLGNSDIANLLKGMRREVIADSAEPKSIQELRYYGLNVYPTDKGKDSVNYGISLLQEKPFKVTKRSVNLIKELRSYTWDKDRDGNTLNKPIDAFNHGVDAIRYVAMMKLRNKQAKPARAKVF